MNVLNDTVTVALVALALLGGCERDGDVIADQLDTRTALSYPQAISIRCRTPGYVVVSTDLPGGTSYVRCVKTAPVPGRGSP